eukprot:COSAG05_NODE_1594_length_4459_cov_7.821682_2_plen_59_part_00
MPKENASALVLHATMHPLAATTKLQLYIFLFAYCRPTAATAVPPQTIGLHASAISIQN